MEQIFKHYEEWEDFKAGMFSLNEVSNKDEKLQDAINLLSNSSSFYLTLRDVCMIWRVATDVNLTNKRQNRRAWLGAAACMFKYNVPEYITREAWGMLDEKVQILANSVADKIIFEYEREDFRVHKNVGSSLLC